nr:hypothetical protein [Tanacetum cinerariifolium]
MNECQLASRDAERIVRLVDHQHLCQTSDGRGLPSERHQNTQQFGALLPIELTNDEIMNSKAYKEYYEIATGEASPKPKVSVSRTRSSSDTSITPPTAAASPRLVASIKGKQTAKASKAKSLYALSEEIILDTYEETITLKRRQDDDADKDEEPSAGPDRGSKRRREGKEL